MTKEEQIKLIEETACDTFMEYMEDNPTEDRFNAPDMVLIFGQSVGTYFAALQAIYWVPFEVWRITHKEGYLKFMEKAASEKKTIHETILDSIIDKSLERIYWAIEKLLPHEGMDNQVNNNI